MPYRVVGDYLERENYPKNSQSWGLNQPKYTFRSGKVCFSGIF
jgi:hypothetical protein